MLTRRRMVSTIGGIGVTMVFQRHALAQTLSLPFLKKFLSIPIAIPSFVAGSPSDSDIADSLAQIVTNDLKRSGLFMPLDPSTFIERITDFEKVPQFPSWKQIGAQILLTGRVARQADSRLKVEIRLWDVATGQQLTGQQYVTALDHGRRLGHAVSDRIYAHMTGETGYFDSRIAFVDESGPSERRIRKLALMDQDGANLRYLTNGTEAVAQPGFVPQSAKICYTQFGGGDPKVCLYDIESGQQERIDGLPAAPFCTPRFAPDGRRLVMSLVQGDRANLFTMDMTSRLITRLTKTPAIDTSPSFSPDGSRICFESDRGGEAQIYVMPATGGEAQRVSSGDGSYSAPAWSPRGDAIAFSKRSGGQSAIGVVKPDGTGERILTARFYSEGPTFNRAPTFAPNGRMLMFVRNPIGNDGPSLYTIDTSGRNELKQPTPGYASDPAWSPLLS